MENAYIYTRVSTLIQVDGFSLDAQETEIRAFAEARKINIVGKYTDEGKSGKNAEHRPAFTQMMEDIRNGVEPREAYQNNIGTYGRYDEAVKYIDPRKE